MAVRIFLLTVMLCRLLAPAVAQEIYPCGLPKNLQYAVQATGRSTGHLLTIVAYNSGAEPISIPAAEVLIPGKDSTLTMICRMPATTLPAGSLQNIVLRGESIAFRRPALTLNERPAPIENWIPANSNSMTLQPGTPLPEGMEPVDTALHKQYLRFPGTDLPLGFIADLENHLNTTAPVLFALHARIKNAYDAAWDAGRIQLPFARDQVYQIGLQESIWYIFSILENKPYTKEELRQSLIEQTERDLVQSYEEMPASTQSYIHQSSEKIWAMIRMVAQGSALEK